METNILSDGSGTQQMEETAGNEEKKIMVKLPVTWEMCGFVEVPTTDGRIETAIQVFDKTCDDIPLPTDGEYVDSSFCLTTEVVEDIAVMTDTLEP